MITPAILILASGSLVSSTLIRLGRAVDQTRMLVIRGEELLRSGNEAGAAVIDQRIERQLRRAELARNALWGYYLAIALFLISSVVLALTQVIHLAHWVGPSIVLFGGVVLIVATASLVVEVGMSAGSLRQEVASYRKGELAKRSLETRS